MIRSREAHVRFRGARYTFRDVATKEGFELQQAREQTMTTALYFARAFRVVAPDWSHAITARTWSGFEGSSPAKGGSFGAGCSAVFGGVVLGVTGFRDGRA